MKSGRAWGDRARRYGRAVERGLHRKNGPPKVLRAILAWLAGRVAVVDMRAVSVIARAAGISRRHCRAMLARLEDDGYIVRVERAGVRLGAEDDPNPHHWRQHGCETSAIVVPALLGYVDLMPRAARARALFDLRRPLVAAALEAVRPRVAEPPNPAVTTADPVVDPAGVNRLTSAPMGSIESVISTVPIPDRSCDPDRSPPTPPRQRAVETSAEGAVAPLPHIALPSCARQIEPRGVPASPAPPPSPSVPEPLRVTAPAPATSGPGAAGSRRAGVVPAVSPHLRGPNVPLALVVEDLVRQGVPEPEAKKRGESYRAGAAWKRHCDATGKNLVARDHRFRAPEDQVGREGSRARREAKAVGKEATAAGGKADRNWTKLRGAWAQRAGGPDFFGWIMALRCNGWTAEAGTLVVRVAGPLEVLERLAHHRAWLEGRGKEVLAVPIHIAWEIAT